jgi:hypothetical protein
MAERAVVFRDRLYGDVWRVERTNDDGEVEIATFSGPDARERAIRYADRQYGGFEEVDPPC